MLSSLRRFSEDEVAQERLRIITFYEQFGEHATKEAFGCGRKTIWVWKKRLEQGKNQLGTLVPTSTKPKTVRRMMTHPEVVGFIKKMRKDHPRLGKEKIKPLLDLFCKQKHLPVIEVSTIGKVIKRNKFFFQKQGRVYHNPDYNYKKRKRKERIRVKYAPKPQELGYIQMDTVLRFIDGIRYYFYSAIDVKGKFAFSLCYKDLNSKNTVDFFKKFEYVCPFKITIVQTDNGLEFLGEFEECLREKDISHVFIYPRCCRVNGVVERYQRSLQEEFVDNNLDIIHNPTLLNQNLLEYLLFYNTERIHESIGKKTPIDYLIFTGEMSKMSVTYT